MDRLPFGKLHRHAVGRDSKLSIFRAPQGLGRTEVGQFTDQTAALRISSR